jgi:hypothetical protein
MLDCHSAHSASAALQTLHVTNDTQRPHDHIQHIRNDLFHHRLHSLFVPACRNAYRKHGRVDHCIGHQASNGDPEFDTTKPRSKNPLQLQETTVLASPPKDMQQKIG